MKTFGKLMVALALAVPAVAAAEPLPKPVKDMECLVGQWKGGGSLQMGQDKAQIQATWDCKRTSAQYGLMCTLRVTGIPGMSAYEETDLMGYEPNTDTYHWYAVTNAGETHDHVAKRSKGPTFQFEFDGVQEGKPLKELIALTFAKHEKRIVGHSETFVDGESVSTMDLTMDK